MQVQLDHLMTYTNARSIDELLEGYRRAGFGPNPHTPRHEPGLRNGIVPLGPEYLELCWVEDPEAFKRGDPQGDELTEDPRVCGVGFVCEDVQALHDRWTARGLSLPAPWSKGEAGSAAGPAWTFQEIPGALLPGASCFALSYHRPRPPEIRPGPNTIYALEGVSLVSHVPVRRTLAWRDLLAPESEPEPVGDAYRVQVGPHFFQWMSPAEFERRFQRPWRPAKHPVGELGVVHVLAHELAAARRCFEAGGRQILQRLDDEGREELLGLPDARDGLFFCIREAQAPGAHERSSTAASRSSQQ